MQEVSGAKAWDQRVGPFFDGDDLLDRFGMTTHVVEGQVASGGMLRVETVDRHALYPSFQFDPSGGLLPRLAEVLSELDPDGSDPWGDANWLNAPAEELGPTTPAEALRMGRAEDVVALARRAGAFRLP